MVAGVRQAMPDARILACPVADGGDGLLEVVLGPEALREAVQVTGPRGDPVVAELGWIDPVTAIFESRTACGLALVPPGSRDPLRTTTRGVGELVWEAIERGAETVIVGLGGSATVDAGTGAARALGWEFYDPRGAPLPEGGGALADLGRMEGGWALAARIVALTDVANPLVGPTGAAPEFGPQKGASAAGVERLSAGLQRVAELFALHGRRELATAAGGGAAGGLGAGLAFFAGARLVPGAEWVLERVGFDAALAMADLVMTGEGRFDRTSFAGKAPGEVVRRAQQARKRVAVVCGASSELVGVPVASAEGRLLRPDDITALAERATREAFGLPLP